MKALKKPFEEMGEFPEIAKLLQSHPAHAALTLLCGFAENAYGVRTWRGLPE